MTSTANGHWKTIPADAERLRTLASRWADIARLPINAERIRLWKLNNALRGERPMVLLEHEGVRNELGIEASLTCSEEWARGVELTLTHTIWHFENVGDDVAVEPYFDVAWFVDKGDYGVTTPF